MGPPQRKRVPRMCPDHTDRRDFPGGEGVPQESADDVTKFAGYTTSKLITSRQVDYDEILVVHCLRSRSRGTLGEGMESS